MPNKPLLSIIIPTKNRQDQLLKTIFAHKFWPLELRDKIQLVISDNSNFSLDNEHLNEIIDIFPNTNYNNTSSYLSVSGNFSRGLKMSGGEWVLYIGDDDFFMPSILDVLYEYDKKDIDCIIYNPNKYYWDNCVFNNNDVNGAPGALVLSKSWEDELIIAENELKRSIRNGGLTIEKMPRIYHGLVRRKIAEKVCLNEFGEMMLGSPDISLATILSCSKIQVQSVSRSLTVYGASDGSGGGMTTSKTHVSPIDKATFLAASFREHWDQKVPKYWSEYTVFPASILFVVNQYKLNLPTRVNYAAIYIVCFLNEYSYRKLILKAILGLNTKDRILMVIDAPYTLARKLLGKLYRGIRKKKKGNKLLFVEPLDLLKYDN